MSFVNHLEKKPVYEAYYIMPASFVDCDNYYCNVRRIIGDNQYKENAVYPKSMFRKYFHGTLIVFTKDNMIINDVAEINANFDVSFEYVTSINLENWYFSASNGVIYNLEDNFFCKNNKYTLDNLKNDLLSCGSFYMQLIIENSTGKVLDITLITEFEDKKSYAYQHRVVKGFLPLDYSSFRSVVNNMNSSGSSTLKDDEILTQKEIDELLKKLYTNEETNKSFTV